MNWFSEPLVQMKSEDAIKRQKACMTVLKLANNDILSQEVLQPLIECLGDSNWQVRGAAGLAIARTAESGIFSKEAFPKLIECLRMGNEASRTYFAQSAKGGRSPDEAIIEVVRRGSDIFELKGGALAGIGSLTKAGIMSNDALAQVVECLRTADINASALDSLLDSSVTPLPDGVDELLDNIGHGSTSKKMALIDIRLMAYAGKTSQEALDQVVLCLSDNNDDVKDAAEAALAAIKTISPSNAMRASTSSGPVQSFSFCPGCGARANGSPFCGSCGREMRG